LSFAIQRASHRPTAHSQTIGANTTSQPSLTVFEADPPGCGKPDDT
jgi:hypothetical protein